LTPIAFLAFSGWPSAAQVTPEEWGAPPVGISHAAGKWTIAGKKNTAVLDEKDLSLTVQSGAALWKMVPSSGKDMLVRAHDDEFGVRLADARDIQIVEYHAGFKTGVKITLDGFQATGLRAPGAPLGLRLYLTVAMEGGDEDLDFEVSAVERGASIRELNWPTAIDGREVDYTVLSNDEGELLPRNWPTRYHPIHRAVNDTSIIQSNLIECWSMSWWGFQKGPDRKSVV
jgi:hypothetical protein